MAPMSKYEFVQYQKSAARMAIESYRFFVEDAFTKEEAAEYALDEVEEVASCFAGIGSCGRGWCNHK